MVTWVPAPSFSRSIARAARDRQYPVARVMLSKTGIRRLLEALDAPVPGDFRHLGTWDQITESDLDRPTVIKPVEGANNRGVFPLVPLRAGLWRDVEHTRDVTLGDIREMLARALVEHDVPDQWIGEELLRAPGDGAIDDVKFLAFRGEIGAAFVRKNPQHSFSWFDREWKPIRPGLAAHALEARATPPPHRAELSALAARISRALPIPFVRVDLFDTSRGPVVGELTPYPGWAHDLGDDLDVELGALYERAESQLIAEGMDWSRLTDVAQVPQLIEEHLGRGGRP